MIVNQNDCQLKPAAARRIARRFGRIDLLLFQFSLAGYYANADDTAGLRRAQQNHLAMIARYVAILDPVVYVPFASFVYFCKTANRFLNDWAVRLDDVAALPALAGRVRICTPGDAVLRDNPPDSAELAHGLCYWTALFTKQRQYYAPRAVAPHELVASAQQFAADVAAASPRFLRPGKTAYLLDDMARYLVIDYRSVSCKLALEPADARLAGRLPAEEALFFLQFPWGADTLNITSAFHVHHTLTWKRSLYLKHLLYVVRPRWKRKLIAPMAWLAAAWRS